MNKKLMVAFILPLFLLVITSCSTVRVPESDSTPPEATIVMSRLEEINRYSHEEIFIGTLSNVVIIAHGHDPDGGIRNTSLVAVVSVACEDINNGESFGLSDDFVIHNPDLNFPPVPERAKKIRSVVFNVTPEVSADWRSLCGEDAVFRALQVRFIASTMNFSGDTDSTNFVIINQP